MWWEVLLVVIIAAMVSLGVAAIVARVVVKPINSIDLKNPDIGESYSEIAPLLHRISEQNLSLIHISSIFAHWSSPPNCMLQPYFWYSM